MFFLPIPTFSTNSRRSACYLAVTNVQCQVEIPTPASITTNRVVKQRLQVSAEIKRLRRLDESGIRSKIKLAQRVLTKITNNRSKWKFQSLRFIPLIKSNAFRHYYCYIIPFLSIFATAIITICENTIGASMKRTSRVLTYCLSNLENCDNLSCYIPRRSLD